MMQERVDWYVSRAVGVYLGGGVASEEGVFLAWFSMWRKVFKILGIYLWGEWIVNILMIIILSKER